MQGITVRLSQRILAALVLWTFYLCSPDDLPAQAAKFYEGKTVRIIVGSSPGGSFDIWARILAEHLGKYIPGTPTVIVQNMGGAGL